MKRIIIIVYLLSLFAICIGVSCIPNVETYNQSVADNIYIAPNPSDGRNIIFYSNNAFIEIQYELYNIRGSKIIGVRHTSNSLMHNINIFDDIKISLPSGIYIMKVYKMNFGSGLCEWYKCIKFTINR